MAKIAPKAVAKASPKPDVKAKAQEKEARQALVSAQVNDFVGPLETLHEAEKTRTLTFLELRQLGAEKVEEHDFTEAEVTDMIRMALAEVGGYDADELVVSKENPLSEVTRLHNTDYAEISLIKRLIFPKEEHKKAFSKALKLMEDSEGAIGIGRLVEVARNGGELKLPGKKGRKTMTETKEKVAKDVFATEDDFKNQLAGDFQKATKSDIDIDSIEAAVLEALESYKEALAEREAESEK